MAIRETKVVALEGAHGSGKTTLVHAVVARLRALGIDAIDVPESARSSPFFDAARLHGGPPVDEWAELHLLGDQIACEQLRARTSGLLVADRTILNVISYWAVRLPNRATEDDELYGKMRDFAIEYSRSAYDLVFLLKDEYIDPSDKLRDADEEFRRRIVWRLERDLEVLGSRVLHVPEGLSSYKKEKLVIDAIEGAGII